MLFGYSQFSLICLVYGQLTVPFMEADLNVLKVISQFPKHNKILHFDNYTSRYFENFISSIEGSLLVINYDLKNILARPLGYKFLNVIYLENLAHFQEFSNDFLNILPEDILLFVTTKLDSKWEEIFYKLPNVELAEGLFILELTGNLYNKCFYCKNKAINRISAKYIHNYINTYEDFHEHQFSIGYISYMPFFWCNSLNCNGPEANLLELLSKKLNFKYTLVNYEHTSKDYGKWQFLVNAVHNRSLDWGVGGLTRSPDRSGLTDLTRALHLESYIVLYRCRGSRSSDLFMRILKPFSFSSWICLVLAFTLVVGLLRWIPDTVKSTVPKSCEILLRAMFEQPAPHLQFTRTSKRLMFITWLYACIILITAYKSKVVSIMIHPQLIMYDSIQEMLQEGYTFQVSDEDWSVLKENWEASMNSETVFQQILRKTSANLTICAALQKVLENKVAYIDEFSPLVYQVYNHCLPHMDAQPISELCLINKEVFPSYHIWPLQLGAPYIDRFSKIIEDLHSAGILTYWYTSTLQKLLVKTSGQSSSTNDLTRSAVAVSMFLLVLGLAFAFVIFLIEIICHRSHTVRRMYKKCLKC
ncbi:hypothetical protein FQA39_LY11566 [Lamprigera yunnana]|nr:hypothetical protein FQA39_LY11566 [Lamprigera yunnana]